jgi:hypothetical protein
MMHERSEENHHSISVHSTSSPVRVCGLRIDSPAAIEMRVGGVILQPSGFPKIAIAK